MSYTNKIRNRVGGICIKDNKILLIKHLNVGKLPVFWLPPGGGVAFGESLEEALVREFLEETHLQVEVVRFLFANEVIALPIHTLEFFFEVKIIGGELSKGTDPEYAHDKQLISEVKFLSFEEIVQLEPQSVHNLFWECTNIDTLLKMRGLYQLIR